MASHHTVNVPPSAYPAATPYGTAAPKQPTAAPAGGVYVAGRSALGSDRKWTKRAILCLILRLLQLIFSVIGLSIMAASHDKVMGFDSHSLDYTNFKGYMWCMVMLILVFAWSFIMVVIDIVEACTSFRTGGVMALATAAIDFFLAFLLFGAACSAATLDTDVVNGTGKFTSRVRAATAFAFVTWLFLIPTMLINIAVVITEVFA